ITGNYVSSVAVSQSGNEAAITVTYSNTNQQKANAAINGKTLVLVGASNGGSISWTCISKTIPQKYLPSSCKGTS
ncbi:MAG: pilin, partial [Thiomonas sp.]